MKKKNEVVHWAVKLLIAAVGQEAVGAVRIMAVAALGNLDGMDASF